MDVGNVNDARYEADNWSGSKSARLAEPSVRSPSLNDRVDGGGFRHRLYRSPFRPA
jgi:hypothetical protein